MSSSDFVNSVREGKIDEKLLSADPVLKILAEHTVKEMSHPFYVDYDDTIEKGLFLGLYKIRNGKFEIDQSFPAKVNVIRNKNEELRQELAEFMAVCYLNKKLDFPKENIAKLKSGLAMLMVSKTIKNK